MFYDAYLERLHERGVQTPIEGFDTAVWNRCLWLETLIANVAPWYLPGDWKGEELKAKLREAELRVRDMLIRLSK